MKNIYAYTGPSPKVGYVGYISVNEKENGVEFSVRSFVPKMKQYIWESLHLHPNNVKI